MEFIRVTNPSNIWLKPNITSTLRQLGSHVISIPFPPSGSLLYRRPEESGREWRYPAQRWGFLHRSGCRPVYVVWKKVITTPLSAFLVGIFEANRNCRQKRQGSARSSSSQGTGVSKEIRPTATAVPACKRGGLRVQRVATYIENIECYLRVASSLVPKNSALYHFCIRHPDLHHSNVIVSMSPDSDQ